MLRIFNECKIRDYMKTFLKFKYSTESIGCGEEENFILKFNEDIIADNDEDGEFLVGKATRYMFLLEEAHEAGYPIFDIFDSNSDFANPLLEIYDEEEKQIKQDLIDTLMGEFGVLGNDNICYFSRLEILPRYRGFGIAKKVIRDNYKVFGSWCGLIVMNPFPLQFELDEIHKLPFEKQMAFGDLEKDEELANKNLRTYYKSIGYIEVPGYNQMFLVPGYHNNKLESIDMDAPIQDLRK